MADTRRSYGTHFAARRVAENSRFRPPHAPEVFDILLSLVATDCGAGFHPTCTNWDRVLGGHAGLSALAMLWLGGLRTYE